MSNSPERKTQLYYIDNIKIFMTALVILHHTAVTYGGPGNWYYNEKTALPFAQAMLTILVSLNQSFFMGFFFLLAAYFTPGSLERKGAVKFLKDRLLRLGVPLLFYSFVFSPLLSYLVYYFAGNHHITYLQYLTGFDSWVDFGVLWFVAALLLFTFIFLIFNATGLRYYKWMPGGTPKTGKILLTGLILGVISFLVRIFFPVGWVLKPLGFQLGHFPQYIACFMIGIAAYHQQWFDKLSDQTGRQLRGVALVLFPLFVIVYVFSIDNNSPLAWFAGGVHWQALFYALWEQTIGIIILTVLLIACKASWNINSHFLSGLSRATFATYIIHPIVIIVFSLLFRNVAFDPICKFIFVAPLAVAVSFSIGAGVLLIPGMKRTL